MLSGNVKINRLQSIIKHFKTGWYVCVFNRFDLLNKMTLEETRVDTPKSVSYRHEKPSVLV